MKYALIFLTVFLLSGTLPCIAQTQYLVRLNVADGSFTKVKKLSGVSGNVAGQAVYDAQKAQYIFCGIRKASEHILYSINTEDYQIVNSPVFNYARYGQYISGMSFNPPDSSIYALHWDNAYKKLYLGKIDATKGTCTDLEHLPNIAGNTFYDATIDAGRQQYILHGTDSTDLNRIYTVNLKDHKIVSAPLSPAYNADSGSIFSLVYDEKLDLLFSIYRNNKTHACSLLTINRETGSFNVISEIPEVQYIAPYKTSYDTKRHLLSFNGVSGSKSLLLTIDVTNGAVVHKTSFPSLQANDYMELPIYDKRNDATYALYWEPYNTHVDENPAAVVEVYPNPFGSKTTIGLGKNYTNINVVLYNSTGRPVLSKTVTNVLNIELEVDRNFIAAGTYYAMIAADGKRFRVIKLVIT